MALFAAVVGCGPGVEDALRRDDADLMARLLENTRIVHRRTRSIPTLRPGRQPW